MGYKHDVSFWTVHPRTIVGAALSLSVVLKPIALSLTRCYLDDLLWYVTVIVRMQFISICAKDCYKL